MKLSRITTVVLPLAAIGSFAPAWAAPLGTAITFEGQLYESDEPVDDVCDFSVTLYDASTSGTQIGSTQVPTNVTVLDGHFKLSLDFGASAFAGDARWADIYYRCPAGSGSFDSYGARVEVKPQANALFAANAGKIGGSAVSTTAPSSGQVLNWSGSAWAPTSDGITIPFATTGSSSSTLLDVTQNGSGTGIKATTSGASHTNGAIYGYATGASSRAVAGVAAGEGGIGVYAQAGSYGNGLYATVNNTEGKAIYAVANSPATVAAEFDGDVQVDGDLTVNGTTTTEVLTITGGSDLAEPFHVSVGSTEVETIKPGMVVAIDPAQPGRLLVASEPYDRRVAGIISGANGVSPGVILTTANRPEVGGTHPVALTGRVWCYADASYGAIEPGDRLTTSSTPGHAMLVSDRSRADGAVVGKAMTGLSNGRGMVLVLILSQ